MIYTFVLFIQIGLVLVLNGIFLAFMIAVFFIFLYGGLFSSFFRAGPV
jgi:hypothetical protein